MNAHTWAYALLSVLSVSLVSLIGITTVTLKVENLRRYMPYLICLAAGAMFGNAFLHLIPEAFERQSGILTPVLILAGIFSFFTVEKILHCRHECATPGHGVHPIGYMSLFADGMENMVDGAIIATAYLIDFHTGLAATVAVLLHEIPTELGDFGVLVHSGFSRKKALLLNFVTGLAAIVGAIFALTVGSMTSSFTGYMTPVAAGAFVYIAAAGLMPRIINERKCDAHGQLVWMLIGVGIMLALTLVE